MWLILRAAARGAGRTESASRRGLAGQSDAPVRRASAGQRVEGKGGNRWRDVGNQGEQAQSVPEDSLRTVRSDRGPGVSSGRDRATAGSQAGFSRDAVGPQPGRRRASTGLPSGLSGRGELGVRVRVTQLQDTTKPQLAGAGASGSSSWDAQRRPGRIRVGDRPRSASPSALPICA